MFQQKLYLNEIGLNLPNSGIRTFEYVPCSFDNEFGVMVHRFDPQTWICRCGSDNVQEKIDEAEARKIARGTPWFRPRKQKPN